MWYIMSQMRLVITACGDGTGEELCWDILDFHILSQTCSLLIINDLKILVFYDRYNSA